MLNREPRSIRFLHEFKFTCTSESLSEEGIMGERNRFVHSLRKNKERC